MEKFTKLKRVSEICRSVIFSNINLILFQKYSQIFHAIERINRTANSYQKRFRHNFASDYVTVPECLFFRVINVKGNFLTTSRNNIGLVEKIISSHSWWETAAGFVRELSTWKKVSTRNNCDIMRSHRPCRFGVFHARQCHHMRILTNLLSR